MPGTPEEYFAMRGFGMSIRHPNDDEHEAVYLGGGALSRTEYRRLRASGAIGPVFADLHSINNPDFVIPVYGTGATAAEAATSAMERWRTEQGD